MGESAAAREALVNLMGRYDRGAEPYRTLWAPILRSAALPLVRDLAGARVGRVLDVGTGVGALLGDLSAAFPGACVLGVDRSHGMLSLAPDGFGRALMDARQLAVRDGSADRVFMLFMLFHVDDPESALREAHRVLRPGGRVGTLTWAGELEFAASRVWAECLDRHGAITPDPDADARHEVVDSPTKMEALLRAAGFDLPRSWEGDLVTTIDAEHLVRLRTNLGASKPRFDSLTPEAAAACVDEARRRLAALRPDDFVARGRVVYAVATRPGPG